MAVAANATFYGRLNSTAGVGSTTWAISSTDELAATTTLTPSGVVNSQVTGTAPGEGASFILQSTINGGIDAVTGDPNFVATTGTAKIKVAAASGRYTICFDEHAEEGPFWWLPNVNAAIRGSGGSGGGSNVLVLAVGASGIGSGGGPGGYRTVLPSADFPGTTTATINATLIPGGGTSSAPAWQPSTAYVAGGTPSVVSANGTTWVCTVGGTSASSGGGPAVEGPSVPDGSGSLVWRSATAVLTVYLATSGGTSVLATLSVGYQVGAAVGGPGAAALNVTANLTSALMALGTRGVVFVGIAGDPDDPSTYTSGTCAWCAVTFA